MTQVKPKSNEDRRFHNQRRRLIRKSGHTSISTSISFNIHRLSLSDSAIKLVQEIESNLGESHITLRRNIRNISNNMYSHHNHRYHKYMKSQNIALSDTESIAIKLWTSSEQFTKTYHIESKNQNKHKWNLFTQSMTSAILKIYVAIILDYSSNKGKNRVFRTIPDQIYRGTKRFDVNAKTWKLDSILSFTTSFNVAETFAALSQQPNNSQNCILKINNFEKYLIEQKIFAAPIYWLSDYEYEKEWVVLPNPNRIIFNVKISSEKINGGNLFNLNLLR